MDCDKSVRHAVRAQVDAAKKADAVYDAAAAWRCVDEQSAVIAACPSTKAGDVNPASSCPDVYRGGDTANGATCISDWECAGSKLGRGKCSIFFEGNEHHYACVAVRATVGLGQRTELLSDEQTRTVCKAGLFAGRDGRCHERPHLAPGAACVDVEAWVSDACEPGAVCDFGNTGKCVVALPLGAECSGSDLCEFSCRDSRCVLNTSAAPYCAPIDDQASP
jgi:hypothetical protein